MYENVYKNETLKIFMDLLSVPSPTGRENLVAEKIMKFADGLGYKSEQDYAGNVVVRVKGNGKSKRTTMTVVHMDEIGLVITGIEKDGSLRVHKLGGMLPWKIGERPVDILTDKGDTVPALTSFGAGHSQVGKNEITWDRISIMTGLTPEQLKERGVRVGSVAVPVREFCGPFVFGDEKDPTVGAWIFDNRLGCAFQLSVLKAMKADGVIPNCDWIFAFVKQEEVKGNGIKPLVVRELPDVLVAVDGGHGPHITLDDGPVIGSKDSLADFSLDVIIALQEAAKAVGLEPEYSVTDVAYNDASLAMQSGGPLKIGKIGYTKDNSHGFEVVKFSMFKKFLDFFYSFVKTYNP
jgi:putative aminopeptidase FrvX